jgi:hypothetical protein
MVAAASKMIGRKVKISEWAELIAKAWNPGSKQKKATADGPDDARSSDQISRPAADWKEREKRTVAPWPDESRSRNWWRWKKASRQEWMQWEMLLGRPGTLHLHLALLNTLCVCSSFISPQTEQTPDWMLRASASARLNSQHSWFIISDS